jgi:translation initiation factor IF-1
MPVAQASACGLDVERIVTGAGEMTETKAERTADGTVTELLPSALVRVRLEGEHQLLAHLPSTQRANFVRLRVGDRVRVALSVQDRTRGRILELLAKG